MAHRGDQALKSFALKGFISPPQITSQQDDYSPTGLTDAVIVRIDSDALRSITGLAGGEVGKVVVLTNVGAFAIRLIKESASSAAANRFALVGDILLVPGGSLHLFYDGASSRWRVYGASGGEPSSPINAIPAYAMFQAAASYIEVSDSSYRSVTAFRFPGANEVSPTVGKAILSANSNGAIGVRIYDVTNSLVIAVRSGLSVTTTPTIYDMGAVSNLPVSEAVFEWQLVKSDTPKPRIHFGMMY